MNVNDINANDTLDKILATQKKTIELLIEIADYLKSIERHTFNTR